MTFLNFNEAKTPITSYDILRKVSEYDIFKRYCKNFMEIDVPFCSELRQDNNPSCRVFISNNNAILYKDFGTGECFNCFGYVSKKFYCNYFESLNIIANDFNIGHLNTLELPDPKIIIGGEGNLQNELKTPKTKVKSIINITSQPFNATDYAYWSQFGISLEVLQDYDVFSAKNVYLFKGNKRYIWEYKKSNPCYAYRFTNDGHYNYKIYWPLEEKHKKWLFSGSPLDIEGYDCLDLHGELLILTKSLKDVLCLRMMDINAVSLQGEHNKLDNETFHKLSKRFDRIVVMYDNDEPGQKGANYLVKTYNLKSVIIPIESGCKDISDYVKKFGLEEGKKLMDKLINNGTKRDNI